MRLYFYNFYIVGYVAVIVCCRDCLPFLVPCAKWTISRLLEFPVLFLAHRSFSSFSSLASARCCSCSHLQGNHPLNKEAGWRGTALTGTEPYVEMPLLSGIVPWGLFCLVFGCIFYHFNHPLCVLVGFLWPYSIAQWKKPCLPLCSFSSHLKHFALQQCLLTLALLLISGTRPFFGVGGRVL